MFFAIDRGREKLFTSTLSDRAAGFHTTSSTSSCDSCHLVLTHMPALSTFNFPLLVLVGLNVITKGMVTSNCFVSSIQQRMELR